MLLLGSTFRRSRRERLTLLRLIVGSLEGRYVELHHRHHGVHHGLHFLGVLVADQLHESPWDDLPRDAERILDPAARGRLRAGLDELVPILVDFRLVLAVNIEGEAFGEGEVRAPVVAHEYLTPDDKL